jgi:hypothetical protein
MTKTSSATTTKSLSPAVRSALLDAAPVHPASLKVLRTDPVYGEILDHGHLRGPIKLAKLTHQAPGVQVWVGHAGVGKTITARQLVHELNAAFAAKSGTYRAFYTMMGGDVDHASQRQMKRGIYALWCAVMNDTLSGGELRQRQERDLAMEIVDQLRLDRVQVLVVDEAGTKNEKEIRGLSLVCDLAGEMEWPLTLLLVGMDDLAHKVDSIPALVSRRRYVHVFTPWDAAACLTFMTHRSPAFKARVAAGDAEVPGALHAIMKLAGGRLREIESLLPELDVRLKPQASLKEVVAMIIDWRTQNVDDANVLADDYLARVQTRRIRAARLAAASLK